MSYNKSMMKLIANVYYFFNIAILIYVVFTFIALGLIINLCLGKKKGLANVPCFLTLSKLFLCITCLERTYNLFIFKKLDHLEDQ